LEKQGYFSVPAGAKTAVAQVKLYPVAAPSVVNGKPYEHALPRLEHRRQIIQPMLVTENTGQYNAVSDHRRRVSGQSGAISHGIARALPRQTKPSNPVCVSMRLLTADARVKERRSPAQAGT